MRSLVLFGLVVLPALLGMAVCVYFLNQDWTALAHAFRHAEEVVAANGDLRAVTIAFDLDRVCRLNCFADGVGLGLCALTFAVGVHGLCAGPHAHADAE